MLMPDVCAFSTACFEFLFAYLYFCLQLSPRGLLPFNFLPRDLGQERRGTLTAWCVVGEQEGLAAALSL